MALVIQHFDHKRGTLNGKTFEEMSSEDFRVAYEMAEHAPVLVRRDHEKIDCLKEPFDRVRLLEQREHVGALSALMAFVLPWVRSQWAARLEAERAKEEHPGKRDILFAVENKLTRFDDGLGALNGLLKSYDDALASLPA